MPAAEVFRFLTLERHRQRRLLGYALALAAFAWLVFGATAWLGPVADRSGPPPRLPLALVGPFVLAICSSAMAALLFHVARQHGPAEGVAETIRTLLGQAMNATAAGVVLVDAGRPDLPIIYVNSAFSRITGYPGDEVQGRNARFLHGDATDARALDEIRRAIQSERPCAVRLLNYRRDGVPFWNDLRVSPIRDPSGRTVYFLGILIDATAEVTATENLARVNADLERRVDERTAALVQRERHLQGILDNIADMVVTIDDRGRITSFNKAAEQTLGWREAEVLGQDIAMIAAEPDRSAHPGYIDRYLKTGESRIMGVRAREVVAQRKDGVRIPVELTIGEIRNNGSRSFVGAMRDITDRLEQKQRLEAGERRFRALAGATPFGLCVSRLNDGEILYVNEAFARMHGSPASALVGRPTTDLYLDAAQRFDVEERLRTAGHVDDLEVQGRRADGSAIWLTLSAVLTDFDGAPAVITGIYDITARKNAEQALLASEAKFRQLSNSMPFGVCVVSRDDGRYRFANTRAAELLRVAPEVLLRSHVRDFYAGSDLRERAAEILRSGESVIELEIEGRRGDGSTSWFSLAAAPIAYDDRACVVIGFYDISQRRDAEVRLRDTAQLLALAQKLTGLGSWEWMIGTDALTWSEETCRIFRVDPAEAVTLGAFHAMIHPDDLDLVRWVAAAAADTGAEYDIHHRIIRRDGACRTVHQIAAVLRDAHGSPAKIVGTIQDVTEQKQTEEALRRSENELRLITDSLPMSVTYVDRDERYRFVNRTASVWYGKAPEDMIGRKVADIVTPSAYARTRAFLERALQGEALRYEVDVDYPNGQARRVDVQYVPNRRPDGTPAGFFAVITDVTERSAMEERLRQAQRMETLGQLTGGIAHDFNNFLGVILGNLDLALHDIKGPARAAELVQRAIGGAMRAAELTKRLLTFSRRQPLKPSTVDVNKLVGDTMELVGRSLGDGIRVELALDPDLRPCLIDRVQLESALMNLVMNARDAMPRGGRIVIATANVPRHALSPRYSAELAPGDYVEIRVSDDGVGMDAAVLGRVFDPFFTTKEIGSGTGLGLSMVYGFMRQSDGDVRIESAPNQGTSVHLLLPGAPAGSAANGCPRADAPDAAADQVLGRGHVVLVVEDDAALRRFSASALEGLGFGVAEAEDAAGAIAMLAARTDISVLFSDVMLPGGRSGLDLAREARALRPDLVMLFTSGFVGRHSEADERFLRQETLLFKPFRVADLAERLRALLPDR